MLYTVRPLECIYAVPYRPNQQNSDSKNKEQEDEYREVQLQHGRITTRRDGENYVIERINSTDMGDYLKENYNPGNRI